MPVFIKGAGKSPKGTAVVGDVISGKTFSNDSDVGLTGTMSNRGAVAITPGTVQQAIAAGYHNGGGYVAGDTDLVAGNIKKGVNIFGVDGAINVAPFSFDTYTGLNNVSGGGITNAVVSADRIFYTTGVASTTLNICNVNGSIINSVALNANQYETIIGFDRYTNHIVTQRTNGGSPYINRYTTAGVFVSTYGPLNTLSGFEFTENYGFNIYYTTSTYYPATWNKSGSLIRYSTTYPIGSSESQYTLIIGLANDQALYVIGYRVLRFNGIDDTVLTRRLPTNGAFLQPK